MRRNLSLKKINYAGENLDPINLRSNFNCLVGFSFQSELTKKGFYNLSPESLNSAIRTFSGYHSTSM